MEPADNEGKNTALGYQAGKAVTTGTGNIFIGYDAGNNTSHDAEDDKLVIANSDTATPLIAGDFSDPSLTINGTLTATGNTILSSQLLNITKTSKLRA